MTKSKALFSRQRKSDKSQLVLSRVPCKYPFLCCLSHHVTRSFGKCPSWPLQLELAANTKMTTVDARKMSHNSPQGFALLPFHVVICQWKIKCENADVKQTVGWRRGSGLRASWAWTCGMILPNLNIIEVLLTAYRIVGGEEVIVTHFGIGACSTVGPFKLPRI